VFQPVTNCAGELNEARSHYNGFLKRQREATDELKAVRSAEGRFRLLSSLNGYLDGAILKPLLRASEGDAGNAVPHTELAHWYGEQWKLFPGEPRVGEKAVAHAMLAQRLDPDGKDGYRAEYALRTMFAEQAKAEAAAQYRFAAKALKAITERDPTEPELRYQLADTLLKADNRAEGLLQAEEALRLDGLVHESRRLNQRQRNQLQKWLAPTGS
jgi:hypothetical protein